MGRFTKIIALVMVLLAALLGTYAWMLSQKSASPPSAPTAPAAASTSAPETGFAVVVAARDIAPNQPMRAEDFKVVALPQRVPGGFGGAQPLIGQLALTAISAGTPITRPALAASVASQLLAGERAMALAVDELSGVGHRILPGDRVDVFVSLKPEQAADGSGYQGQSRLLTSSLRVLGYGTNSLGDPADEAGEESGGAEAERTQAGRQSRNDSAKPARAASSAVLAVPVEQVNTLAQAAQGGRLLLTLRNPVDQQTADASLFPKPASVLAVRADLDDNQKAALAEPVNQAYAGLDAPNLGGSIAAAKPPRPATRTSTPPRRTLEVIRGDQRSQTTY